MSDAERENIELTQFEQKERETQTEAIDRVKRAIELAQGTSRDKLKIADRVVSSADRLRAESYLGDIELLESREKLYVIRDDLNKGKSRLAELELEAITAENARSRAQLERSLKIRQLKTRLALDRDKLTRTSRIVSRVARPGRPGFERPGRAGPRGFAGRLAACSQRRRAAPMTTGPPTSRSSSCPPAKARKSR